MILAWDRTNDDNDAQLSVAGQNSKAAAAGQPSTLDEQASQTHRYTICANGLTPTMRVGLVAPATAVPSAHETSDASSATPSQMKRKQHSVAHHLGGGGMPAAMPASSSSSAFAFSRSRLKHVALDFLSNIKMSVNADTDATSAGVAGLASNAGAAGAGGDTHVSDIVSLYYVWSPCRTTWACLARRLLVQIVRIGVIDTDQHAAF
jgi:hypothetical protein